METMRTVGMTAGSSCPRVDEHGTVKVADFGLSRELFSRDYYRIGEGNPALPIRWMAPECLETKVFTSMSDVVSSEVNSCTSMHDILNALSQTKADSRHT